MNSNKPVPDITPVERRLLSHLRCKPGLFLGQASLRNFNHMANGYCFAMRMTGDQAEHNLLPDGLNAFTADWYGESMGGHSCFSMIAAHEPDDGKALETFFEILDAYLVRMGYEPLPEWDGNADYMNLSNQEAPMEPISNRNPDVEVTFQFNGKRRSPVADGYRPAHAVREDYLTTGVHHYFGVTEVAPDGTARGTITFITPEVYPGCLWVGKRIPIQEGERVVGHATVEKVLNPVLERK